MYKTRIVPAGDGGNAFLGDIKMFADQKVSIPLVLRCADKNDLHELTALGDAGFSLSDASKGGLTALHCAARNGHADVIAHLLRNACDPNAQDVFGDTALHISICYSHVGCALLLARHDQLQPDVCDKLGRSALHVLAETFASADVSDDLKALVEALLLKGFKPNVADKMGRSPESIAKSDGLRALLKQ